MADGVGLFSEKCQYFLHPCCIERSMERDADGIIPNTNMMGSQTKRWRSSWLKCYLIDSVWSHATVTGSVGDF